jgi:glucose-6-phosphate-specific signal transduction histidine kinase
VDRQDLMEMLGNLLENACQWAQHQVTVSVAQSGRALLITVSDDGRASPPRITTRCWPVACGWMRRSRAAVSASLSRGTLWASTAAACPCRRRIARGCAWPSPCP